MAFPQGTTVQTSEYATFNDALKSHTFPNVFADGKKQRTELKRHITQESLSKSLPPPPPRQSVLPVSSTCKPKRPPRSSPSKTLLAPCESKSLASSCLPKQSSPSPPASRSQIRKDRKRPAKPEQALFHFVGPDHSANPQENTILWCLVFLVIFIVFLSIAARFPVKAVRVVFVSFSGVGLVALAMAVIADFITHGELLLRG